MILEGQQAQHRLPRPRGRQRPRRADWRTARCWRCSDPNGGGKTTLLKTLLGLLAPKAGEVRLDGAALSSRSIRERARLIAYVPQTHVATFAFSVEAVVLMGRTAHGDLFARPSSR